MEVIAERSGVHRRCYAGVFTVPLFTAPFPCGGDCVYCPSEKGLPRSYILNGGTKAAVKAAFSARDQFDRYVYRSSNFGVGLPFEIIILGGSFSNLNASYRQGFLEELYARMGEQDSFGAEHIDDSPYRCSILTVEARPDQITQEECSNLRALGVSKVELGVQHLQESVLETCNRGHGVETVRKATQLLKTGGFKVGYHIMIGLPGSNFELDDHLLREQLWSAEYMPDFLKVYPCVLLRDRTLQPELHKMIDKGYWKPPSAEYIQACLKVIAKCVPSTVRISRVQRFFPEDQVAGGLLRGVRENDVGTCHCIRCREVGKSAPEKSLDHFTDVAFRTTQAASDTCIEIIADRDILLALARVYKGDVSSSMLRELHVYGRATRIGSMGPIQGRGLGSRLLGEVERQVRLEGRKSLFVNAAFGARGFFKKHGYIETSTHYLRKTLEPQSADIHDLG